MSYVESAFSKIVMPIQNGLTYIKNKVAGNQSFFTDINNLQSENEELKQLLEQMEEEIYLSDTIIKNDLIRILNYDKI